MSIGVANMVAQQSSATGTGDRALDGAALANCRVFSAAFAAGDVVHATILDRTTGDTEVGVYVVRASPSRLEVQSIRLAFGPNASGATSPVSFAAGTKDVLCDVQAEDVAGLPATETPTANAIPKAASTGRLAPRWLPRRTPLRLGTLYGLPSATHALTVAGNIALVSGNTYLFFFEAIDDVVITNALAQVAVAGTAGATATLSIYNAAVTTGVWGATTKVADLGSVAIDSTGVRTISGLSTALAGGGLYALAVSVTANCTLVGALANEPGLRRRNANPSNPFDQLLSYYVAGVASPADLTGGSLVGNVTASTTSAVSVPFYLAWTTP